MNEEEELLPPSADDAIDPDPFAIGFTILGILFAGGSYLETRRQHAFIETQAQNEFRRAWFECRRTLIHARRVVEEFATYVAEDNFGTREFIFGKVRLTVDTGRAQQLKRLHGNAHTTAEHMADDLDRLANFLSAAYQPQIEAINKHLMEMTQLPDRYREVITVARNALVLYEDLVNAVEDAEKFEESTTSN
jgi:hypothetical protein